MEQSRSHINLEQLSMALLHLAVETSRLSYEALTASDKSGSMDMTRGGPVGSGITEVENAIRQVKLITLYGSIENAEKRSFQADPAEHLELPDPA